MTVSACPHVPPCGPGLCPVRDARSDPLDDLVLHDQEALERREQRNGMTLAQVTRAIEEAIRQERPVDDIALLWLCKAALLGLSLTPMHLVLLMGVSVSEGEDIFARISERGLADCDDA